MMLLNRFSSVPLKKNRNKARSEHALLREHLYKINCYKKQDNEMLHNVMLHNDRRHCLRKPIQNPHLSKSAYGVTQTPHIRKTS